MHALLSLEIISASALITFVFNLASQRLRFGYAEKEKKWLCSLDLGHWFSPMAKTTL